MVINERDILGTQLIRRNEELALLYEKIKLQQCTLNQGECAYNERIADAAALGNRKRMFRVQNLILHRHMSSNVVKSRFKLSERTICIFVVRVGLFCLVETY